MCKLRREKEKKGPSDDLERGLVYWHEKTKENGHFYMRVAMYLLYARPDSRNNRR
jgi:hypothetical protein